MWDSQVIGIQNAARFVVNAHLMPCNIGSRMWGLSVTYERSSRKTKP